MVMVFIVNFKVSTQFLPPSNGHGNQVKLEVLICDGFPFRHFMINSAVF